MFRMPFGRSKHMLSDNHDDITVIGIKVEKKNSTVLCPRLIKGSNPELFANNISFLF